MQLLDDASISAGDLDSCLVALYLTYLFKLLNITPFLQAQYTTYGTKQLCYVSAVALWEMT